MPCRICSIAHLIHDLYATFMANLILSIATFAALLLLWGAWKRWRSDGAGKQMWLMIVASLVIFGNIAIWVVPDGKGQSLLTGTSDRP